LGFGAAAGRTSGTTLPPAGAAAFPAAGFAGAGFAAAVFPGAGFAFATGFGLAAVFDGTSLRFGFRVGAADFLATGFLAAGFLSATFFATAFRDGFEGRTGFFATDFRTAAAARLTVIFSFFAAFATGLAFGAAFRFGTAFTLETVLFEGVTLPEGFLAPPVFFPFTGMAILAGPEVYP
jgi:hypothetical protein